MGIKVIRVFKVIKGFKGEGIDVLEDLDGMAVLG